jgi:hypothetical protein
VLGYGGELGAISDSSPVVATNTASGAYKAIIASIFPELNRLSRDGITPSGSVGSGKFSHIGFPAFCCYSMRFANVAVDDRSAGQIYPIAGTYCFHSDRELCRGGPPECAYTLVQAQYCWANVIWLRAEVTASRTRSSSVFSSIFATSMELPGSRRGNRLRNVSTAHA